MTAIDTNVDRLELLVSRLERLGVGRATPRAPVDPDNTPGNVATGELIESAWGNAVVDNIDGLRATMPSTSAPYVGAWPVGIQWPQAHPLWRGGHAVIATSAFGDMFVPFPVAFPNGTVAVLVTPTAIGGTSTWWPDITSTALTGFQMYAMSYEGAPYATVHPPSQPAIWSITGVVTFDYLALGV